MSDDDIPINSQEGAEEEEDVELPEDLRVHIIGSILHDLDSKFRVEQACTEEKRGIYGRIDQVVEILVWSFLIIIFVAKPPWCEAFDDAINAECTLDNTGREYKMSFVTVIDADYLYYPTAILMLIVVFLQFIKYTWSRAKRLLVLLILQSVFAILVTVISIFSISIEIVPMRLAGGLVKLSCLVFIISNNEQLVIGLVRLLRLVTKSMEATFLWLVNFVFFALVIRCTCYSFQFIVADHDGGSTFSTSRMDSMQRTLYTLWILSTGDVWPGIMFKFTTTQYMWGVFVLAFFFVFTGVIIVSILTGVFAAHFDQFYADQTDALVTRTPGYKRLILYCMEAPVLRPDDVKRNFVYYQEHGMDALAEIDFEFDADEVEVEIAPTNADRLDSEIHVVSRWSFKRIYNSRIYNVISAFIDIFICFIPIYKMDTFRWEQPTDNAYLTSEILVILTIAEAAVVASAYPAGTKHPLYMIKIVSSVVVFVTSNLLQYTHYDIQEKEIMDRSLLFKIWALASLFKILGFHTLLKFSSRWISILQGIRQVAPMLKDLLLIYLLILLIFSVIGGYLYGGDIGKFNEKRNKDMTGNDWNDNWEYLNFNDITNSLNFLFSLTPQSGWSDMMQMAISCGGGPWLKYFFGWVFFFSYFFLGILLILGIILGMVLNFISVYLGEAEEAEMEKEKTKIPLWNRLFRLKKKTVGDGDDEKPLVNN